jgi:hypothetical protein
VAGPAYGGRRARSRTGQLAAFGGVVLLLSTALAVLGGAVLPVLDGGSRTVVAQAGAADSALRVTANLRTDAEDQDATIRGVITEALRELPADIERTVTADALAVIHDQQAPVQLLVDPGIRDAAELVAGDWPAGPAETAIADAAAARLEISPGETVALGDATLTVTGTWRAADPAAARWFGDPAPASGADGDAAGPLLVDESVLADLPGSPHVRWTVLPRDGALRVSALPEVADAIARLDTALRRLGGAESASLEGGLAPTVARATRVTAVAAGVLGLPLVLVTVAGAIVLGLIARSLAGGRGAEYVLLKARGASLRALAGAATREAGAVSTVGALLGAGLAGGILLLGLPALGAEVSGAALLVPVAIAAGVALLATALATIATVTELRAPVTGRAEAGRAAVLAAVGPLLLALVAAGLALAQFLALGAPVVVRSNGVVRTDPLALTAPVLVLLAGALAAPAIAGPAVAVAERIARGAPGILPVLPLRQLARRARAAGAAVLVVALAAGAVVVAAAFHAGAEGVRRDAEHAATGADLRVQLPVRTTVDPSAAAASATLLDGVPNVDSATAVLTGTAMIGQDPVALTAADLERIAALPDAGFAPGLVPDLTASRSGAELPPGTTGLTVALQLDPGSGVPADAEAEVTAWLADRDGSALRVPLGNVPIEGAVEVTADIPPADRLIAVEVRGQLPAGAVVALGLTSVTTTAGDAVAVEVSSGTTLVTSKAGRILPVPADDAVVLPVVLSDALAGSLGVAAGDRLAIRVNAVSAPLQVVVAAVQPRLPGTGTEPAILLDLETLEARAIAAGGSVPAADELWVETSNPDAAAAAIRGVLTQRARLTTPQTLSPAPLISPTLLLLELGVAVTGILAVLGFAAVAAAIGRLRRTELAPLRSLGLSAARIRAARAIELASTAAIALVLGALAGLLTAALVVPGLVGVLA